MTYTNTSACLPTAEDYAQAKQVAEWLFRLSETEQVNDYLHNLSVYGKAGVLNAKGIGLVASAVQAFKREHARELRATEAEAGVSKHVGKEGERLTLKVRLISVYDTVGAFGTTYIHKFEVIEGPEAGARLTWFGSTHLHVSQQPDDPFWIKGTVKRHNEYKEVKETILSRVTLVSAPEENKKQKTAKTKKANKNERAAP